MGKCINICVILTGVIGLVLFILGFVLAFKVFPDVIKEEIMKSVQLEPDTDQWDRFVQLPIPMTFKVYMFNVTNPKEIENGLKPIVQEVGPYIYKLYRKKTNIKIDDVEDTIDYRQFSYYEFDYLASFPLLDTDKITMLNVPLQGAFQFVEKTPSQMPFMETGWKCAFQTESLFHEVIVKDYLLDGYNFCTKATQQTCPGASFQSNLICNQIKTQKLKTLEVFKNFIQFSFFNFKQRKHDGNYTVNSGLQEAKDVGQIIKWENNTQTQFWKNENSTCSQIGGTDSSIFPPYNEKDNIFEVYSTDICRKVKLVYDSEIEYKGVSGFRNVASKDTFAANSDNECYCINQTKTLDGTFECQPDGFNDLFNCLGAPVLLSFPHMLWAEEKYTTTVEGLDPVESKHINFVDYEPDTGTPLRGAKRVQFNMILSKIEGLSITNKLKGSVLPLIWVDEGIELTDELIEELKSKYLGKLTIVAAVQWVLVAVGALMVIGSIAGIIYIKKK